MTCHDDSGSNPDDVLHQTQLSSRSSQPARACEVANVILLSLVRYVRESLPGLWGIGTTYLWLMSKPPEPDFHPVSRVSASSLEGPLPPSTRQRTTSTFRGQAARLEGIGQPLPLSPASQRWCAVLLSWKRSCMSSLLPLRVRILQGTDLPDLSQRHSSSRSLSLASYQ